MGILSNSFLDHSCVFGNRFTLPNAKASDVCNFECRMPSGSLPFLWTLTSCVLSEAGCCCCCCSFRLLTVPAMDSIRPDFLIIYGFITELLLMFIDAGGRHD